MCLFAAQPRFQKVTFQIGDDSVRSSFSNPVPSDSTPVGGLRRPSDRTQPPPPSASKVASKGLKFHSDNASVAPGETPLQLGVIHEDGAASAKDKKGRKKRGGGGKNKNKSKRDVGVAPAAVDDADVKFVIGGDASEESHDAGLEGAGERVALRKGSDENGDVFTAASNEMVIVFLSQRFLIRIVLIDFYSTKINLGLFSVI